MCDVFNGNNKALGFALLSLDSCEAGKVINIYEISSRCKPRGDHMIRAHTLHGCVAFAERVCSHLRVITKQNV